MKANNILSMTLGAIWGVAGTVTIMGDTSGKMVNKWKTMSDKHFALFMLLNKWIKTKQEGKHIRTYFEKNGYKSVAIYGLSYVGERLLEELNECDVEIKYAVDRNAQSIYSDIKIYTVEDELPEVDVMIVTAVYFFDDIYNDLVDKVNCPIVSLEDVLYEID